MGFHRRLGGGAVVHFADGVVFTPEEAGLLEEVFVKELVEVIAIVDWEGVAAFGEPFTPRGVGEFGAAVGEEAFEGGLDGIGGGVVGPGEDGVEMGVVRGDDQRAEAAPGAGVEGAFDEVVLEGFVEMDGGVGLGGAAVVGEVGVGGFGAG